MDDSVLELVPASRVMSNGVNLPTHSTDVIGLGCFGLSEQTVVMS